jgi:hypothetical protein
MKNLDNINTYFSNKNINFKKNNLLFNPNFYRKLDNFFEGKTNKTIEYKIKIQGTNDYIIIEEDKNEKQDIIYSLMTNDKDANCLFMLQEGNTIHIESINAWDNCLTFEKGKINGSFILKTALAFIDSIKDEKKIKKITLIDKSEKKCQDPIGTSYFFNLSDFKILLTGETWYTLSGFIPATKKLGSQEIIKDKVGYKEYQKNKKIISSLLVKDSHIIDILNKKIIKKTLDSSGVVKKLLEELLFIMKKNENKLLSKILKKYFSYEKFNERCVVLKYIMKKLFEKNNLTSFNNKIFIKKI